MRGCLPGRRCTARTSSGTLGGGGSPRHENARQQRGRATKIPITTGTFTAFLAGRPVEARSRTQRPGQGSRRSHIRPKGDGRQKKADPHWNGTATPTRFKRRLANDRDRGGSARRPQPGAASHRTGAPGRPSKQVEQDTHRQTESARGRRLFFSGRGPGLKNWKTTSAGKPAAGRRRNKRKPERARGEHDRTKKHVPAGRSGPTGRAQRRQPSVLNLGVLIGVLHLKGGPSGRPAPRRRGGGVGDHEAGPRTFNGSATNSPRAGRRKSANGTECECGLRRSDTTSPTGMPTWGSRPPSGPRSRCDPARRCTARHHPAAG